MDAILDKTLRGTVALLAARGREESAALGLVIAGDVVAGYSIIAVTAPSPENLKTLFEFISKGFDVLEYREHEHYDVVKSANRGFKNETLRINIYKQNRQNIQYIHPHEHEKLSKVDLMVIDEAAAIPLPILNYEGTGQSSSLKIVQQMEEQSRSGSANGGASLSGCHFRKIELTESFRYASGDPIESWLNSLLCLDASNYKPYISRLPPSDECGLYYVHRDPFFSYHKESQLSLQLMADAPAHHMFVLLGPVVKSKNQLPDILCVIQVPLNCQISRKSAMKSLNDGQQPLGDQIPPNFVSISKIQPSLPYQVPVL